MTSSFSGKYYYTVDPKGRLMIPAPFRQIITANFGPKLYVTNDVFDKCLHIYPFEEWAALQEKVRNLPRVNEAISYFKRKVIASAIEVEMDRQGRILLPLSLRQDMGINGEAVIVGLVEKIEIWDRTVWEEVMDTSRVDIEGFRKAFGEFGL